MKPRFLSLLILSWAIQTGQAASPTPAPQKFYQEVARSFSEKDGLPTGQIQLIQISSAGNVAVFVNGIWHDFQEGKWKANKSLSPASDQEFTFPNEERRVVRVSVPWREVKQLLQGKTKQFLTTGAEVFGITDGKLAPLGWHRGQRVNQMALSREGTLHVGGANGLFEFQGERWVKLEIDDGAGRHWGVKDVLGVAFDSQNRLWFATKAGVGCRTGQAWKFYEGKDGLPWNEFTWAAAGSDGEIWFGTRLGAIRFDGSSWHYRQGPRWLPNDEVIQVGVDATGSAWFATAGALGCIEKQPMTLARKAEFYEEEIERYIKRTPFGFVAEAALRTTADKSTADPHDTDNDGLWTAMYGAGECFAFGATKDPKAKERAKKAFEALRFLQKVTEGCSPAPPKGYIARTIRSVDLPDPNIGRLEADRRAQQQNDKLWKIYEPRWPKSADGKWFWKSDTSSDELDGNYFFYPLYYELCADTDSERERVRDVVRGITDHLLAHNYVLMEHDGKPTRWGIFGPQFLNHDPNWWPERGLNSLSMLSYLAVAAHVTGDAKYRAASRELIEQHSYAMNAMYPKVQHGPGSGNQSDDEMAFMSYYALLMCSKDEKLDPMIRYSFFRYWANEAPEMNPFFNFAYAAHNLNAGGSDPWANYSLAPWQGWHEDSMATLFGFPLDRLNWPHKNSHRLDVVQLGQVQSRDIDSPDESKRGRRVNGKALPVENRHFNHWNTDPWQLDYGGSGNHLAAGTVFLLPYYMGLYHKFIELPKP